MSYRGRVRLGVNVDTALVKSEEDARHLIEDTVEQTTSLLMDLRAAEDHGNALHGSESELLLSEPTRLPSSPGHYPARGHQAPPPSIV